MGSQMGFLTPQTSQIIFNCLDPLYLTCQVAQTLQEVLYHLLSYGNKKILFEGRSSERERIGSFSGTHP